MNGESRIKYDFAKMYGYARDIVEICRAHRYDYEEILGNIEPKHAINMCIVQLGEFARDIRDLDKDLYEDPKVRLKSIKGMLDKITHSYDNIDLRILKDVLENGVPELMAYIEAHVDPDVLENPYMLYEIEYQEYMQEKYGKS